MWQQVERGGVTVFSRYIRRFGGLLRTGRKRETITPIAWERPFLGSQKFLLPDLVIEQEDRTIFVDAKYKDQLGSSSTLSLA